MPDASAQTRPVATAAVLDACVLFQGVLTNFLLCIADAGAFDPIWSLRIHEEWSRALQQRLPADKIAYRKSEMDRSFPGALCPHDEALLIQVRSLCISDRERKDAHVAATALSAGAARIITHNVRDFSRTILDRFGLSATDPDNFCLALLEADRQAFLAGARTHRTSMQRFALTPSDYLAFLAARAHLPATARLLTAHIRDI